MKKAILILFIMLTITSIFAQEKNYFYQIPAYPEKYTAENVAARMVDGLGFRYYWATEGLRNEDLDWSPGDKTRSSLATLEHILGLTTALVNAVNKRPTVTTPNAPKLSYEQIRTKTLENLKEASIILKQADVNLHDYKMIFQSPNRTSEYPFWNLINGPIADALWHVGQVVSFRRSSGNPFPEGVNVLQGKKN